MTTAAPSAPAATSVAPSRTIWFDGRLYGPEETPSVPVTDHGFVVGDGVFEALKITAAGPFAVQRHLDRMTRSAASLELPPPDHAVVRGAIEAVCADQAWEFGKIRITYTGGVGPLGSQAAYGPPNLVVIAEPTAPPAPTVEIVTAPWRRNEHGALTGVKSTSYGENVRGLAYAHARDASETIFLNTAGDVCEGTGTNIFCVFGNRILTPPLVSGPLAGRHPRPAAGVVRHRRGGLHAGDGRRSRRGVHHLVPARRPGRDQVGRGGVSGPGSPDGRDRRAVPGQERRARRSVSRGGRAEFAM